MATESREIIKVPETPEDIIEQALRDDTIAALRKEAYGENEVSFLIVDMPDPKEKRSEADMLLFGPALPNPVGKLHAYGLDSNKITISLTDIEETIEGFRTSIDISSRKVTIEYCKDEDVLTPAKDILMWLAANTYGFLRLGTRQLGRSMNQPPPIVPAIPNA